MAKNKKTTQTPNKKVPYNLPKGSLVRVNLGQSFAEYDLTLNHPYAFVETPAIKAAMSENISKCFYIGRRGTGKTATTFFLSSKFEKNSISILPQLFSAIEVPFTSDELRDTRQRPFKSLVTCFKRALLDEVLLQWTLNGSIKKDRLSGNLSKEKNYFENFDFDLRMLTFSEEIFEAYHNRNQREWLRLINRPKEIAQEMDEWRTNKTYDFYLLIDRIDESWDGSDKSVILLMD
jgi:Cdc6-like AAA superfamily ATPase